MTSVRQRTHASLYTVEHLFCENLYLTNAKKLISRGSSFCKRTKAAFAKFNILCWICLKYQKNNMKLNKNILNSESAVARQNYQRPCYLAAPVSIFFFLLVPFIFKKNVTTFSKTIARYYFSRIGSKIANILVPRKKRGSTEFRVSLCACLHVVAKGLVV